MLKTLINNDINTRDRVKRIRTARNDALYSPLAFTSVSHSCCNLPQTHTTQHFCASAGLWLNKAYSSQVIRGYVRLCVLAPVSLLILYLQTAWMYFNETHHNYSLPAPHDTDDIFKVMGSKVIQGHSKGSKVKVRQRRL